MEEKIITLEENTYNDLKRLLNSNQQTVHFRCKYTDELLSIPNANKSKSNNANNEKNIVERWMNDIRDMATIGCQEASERNSERYFSQIKSYCEAVIISVTS